MRSITLGDFTIFPVLETYIHRDPADFFPDLTPEKLKANRSWIDPRAFDEQGFFKLPIQTYVVRSRNRTVVVDTCYGNDKRRREGGAGHMLKTSFLKDLTVAGVKPEEVDFVMCTHLHADHVGWNTRLENGRWVPTFPKAKYLFGRKDWDLFSARAAQRPGGGKVIGDSVTPVVEAGQGVMVDGSHQVDDGIRIEPLPGHTPGHAGVYFLSKGRTAIMTGDMLHHPLQLAEPDWNSNACEDPAQARATRRAFIERHADTGDLVVPADFPEPGYITRAKEGWRFKT